MATKDNPQPVKDFFKFIGRLKDIPGERPVRDELMKQYSAENPDAAVQVEVSNLSGTRKVTVTDEKGSRVVYEVKADNAVGNWVEERIGNKFLHK